MKIISETKLLFVLIYRIYLTVSLFKQGEILQMEYQIILILKDGMRIWLIRKNKSKKEKNLEKGKNNLLILNKWLTLTSWIEATCKTLLGLCQIMDMIT